LLVARRIRTQIITNQDPKGPRIGIRNTAFLTKGICTAYYAGHSDGKFVLTLNNRQLRNFGSCKKRSVRRFFLTDLEYHRNVESTVY